jgi:DNA mismatch repair protein MutS2
VLAEEARELLDRLRRAREELREAQARLRAKKVEPEALREAERAIARVAGQVAIGGVFEPLLASPDEEPRDPVRALDLRKGTRVWVPRLRAEAEVVEVMGEQVRVAAGPLKLLVVAAELRAVSRPQPPPSRPAGRAGSRLERHEPADPAPIQTRDNTCDLRGLRVDDAVTMATSFLDRALTEGRSAVFLLHGHGTGALREALRRELSSSRYVARFRGGESDQGGDGVTVVWLA